MPQPADLGPKRGKHSQPRTLEINLKVALSDEVLNAFGDLYNLVHGDPAFKEEPLLSLKEFACLPISDLIHMLTALPLIAQQVEQHVTRSNDLDARYALDRAIHTLNTGVTKIPSQPNWSR